MTEIQMLTLDMTVKVPLEQLWEAFKDLHHLMPRLLPGYIESSRISGGPVGGGVGSTRDCQFSSDVPGISSTKELIEEVDDEKHVFAYKVVAGEVLKHSESFRVTWQFTEQLAGPGTDVKWTAEIAPLTETDKDKDGKNKKGGKGVDPKVEAKRREDLYRDSAELLMKQLETHLAVTGEYKQPSAKDRLRDDILLN